MTNPKACYGLNIFLGYFSVMILPPFFHFLHSCNLMCPQFPCYLPMGSHHVPSNHGTYPCLWCTHMHYPIHPCPCLVPYSCATASHHVPLTHSSPFSTIHLPHLICFLLPVHVTDTSCFTLIRSLTLLFLTLYYT
jgi:hypothetical protein